MLTLQLRGGHIVHRGAFNIAFSLYIVDFISFLLITTVCENVQANSLLRRSLFLNNDGFKKQ